MFERVKKFTSGLNPIYERLVVGGVEKPIEAPHVQVRRATAFLFGLHQEQLSAPVSLSPPRFRPAKL